jgi:integrase
MSEMEYLMRGMNWLDMCMLRLSNIVGDFERIQYARSKTNKRFSIKIGEKLKEIIMSYVKDKKAKEDFIFSVLKLDDDPDRYHETIKNKRKRLNKRLKEIATLCEIDNITIYTARHTYATMGKRRGVPTAVIQESLGHKTEAITQTYLDSFDNKVVDDYDEVIMSD